MRYSPKRQIEDDRKINWGGIALAVLIVFSCSILFGRWLGTHLLSSRVGLKPPVQAQETYQAPPSLPSESPSRQSFSQSQRETINPPPLVVPPPVVEPTPGESPEESTEAAKEPSPAKETEAPPREGQAPRVQAGLFVSQDNAQELINKLKEEGYACNLERVLMGNVVYFRVWLGPYATRDLASKAARELNGKGYQAFVFEEQPQEKEKPR